MSRVQVKVGHEEMYCRFDVPFPDPVPGSFAKLMDQVRQKFSIKYNGQLELEWTDAANDVNCCSNDCDLAIAITEMSQSAAKQLKFKLAFVFVSAPRNGEAVGDSGCPLLALFNNAIAVDENGFATFEHGTHPPVEWAPSISCIYIQEWYKTFTAALFAEWRLSDNEVDENGARQHACCKRLCELNGNPGTGTSLCALYLISVLSRTPQPLSIDADGSVPAAAEEEPHHFGQPDILLVRRDGPIGEVRRDESVRLDLLHRSTGRHGGKTQKHSLRCRINGEQDEAVLRLLANRWHSAQKLMVIIDSVWPQQVLDCLHRTGTTAHMCLSVSSMETHDRIIRSLSVDSQPLYCYNNLWMLVTHVRRSEFLKFGSRCAPAETQLSVENIIHQGQGQGQGQGTRSWLLSANSGASCSASDDTSPGAIDTAQDVVGYAFDILGANARYPLQISWPLRERNDGYFRNILLWLKEADSAGAPHCGVSLSARSREFVLAACADVICQHLDVCLDLHHPPPLSSSMRLVDMFLQSSVVELDPIWHFPHFEVGLASPCMHHVLTQLWDQRVPCVLRSLQDALGSTSTVDSLLKSWNIDAAGSAALTKGNRQRVLSTSGGSDGDKENVMNGVAFAAGATSLELRSGLVKESVPAIDPSNSMKADGRVAEAWSSTVAGKARFGGANKKDGQLSNDQLFVFKRQKDRSFVML